MEWDRLLSPRRVACGGPARDPQHEPARSVFERDWDGLFKHVAVRPITASVTGSVTEVADRLVSLPRLPSGGYPDDVAVVVARRC
jgi:hypothetical protein